MIYLEYYLTRGIFSFEARLLGCWDSTARSSCRTSWLWFQGYPYMWNLLMLIVIPDKWNLFSFYRWMNQKESYWLKRMLSGLLRVISFDISRNRTSWVPKRFSQHVLLAAYHQPTFSVALLLSLSNSSNSPVSIMCSLPSTPLSWTNDIRS